MVVLSGSESRSGNSWLPRSSAGSLYGLPVHHELNMALSLPKKTNLLPLLWLERIVISSLGKYNPDRAVKLV